MTEQPTAMTEKPEESLVKKRVNEIELEMEYEMEIELENRV